MSDFHDHFSALLKQRRKLANLSQRVVAERAGVSAEFISRMERGLTLPALDTFSRLCDALVCTPNDLLLDKPYADEVEALSARLSSSAPDVARAAVYAAEAILAYVPERH